MDDDPDTTPFPATLGLIAATVVLTLAGLAAPLSLVALMLAPLVLR